MIYTFYSMLIKLSKSSRNMKHPKVCRKRKKESIKMWLLQLSGWVWTHFWAFKTASVFLFRKKVINNFKTFSHILPFPHWKADIVLNEKKQRGANGLSSPRENKEQTNELQKKRKNCIMFYLSEHDFIHISRCYLQYKWFSSSWYKLYS